jgi:hypothetical protein
LHREWSLIFLVKNGQPSTIRLATILPDCFTKADGMDTLSCLLLKSRYTSTTEKKKDFSYRSEKVIRIGFTDAIGVLHQSADAIGLKKYC